MVLTNDNDTIALEGDFRLEELFIGGCKLSHTASEPRGLFGSALYGISSLGREVKIVGYIAADLEANRRRLCQLCTQQAPFWLVDGDYRLELALKYTVEFSNERRFTDKLLKFTIKALCQGPYWLYKEDISRIFYNCGGVSTDDNAIMLTNIGDAEVGFQVNALIMSSCKLLTLIKGDKRLTINREFKIMDRVFIDTRHGKKSVYHLPEGESEAVNVIEYVSPDSEFFGLDAGENRIDFVVSQGVSYMTITYTPAYLR